MSQHCSSKAWTFRWLSEQRLPLSLLVLSESEESKPGHSFKVPSATVTLQASCLLSLFTFTCLPVLEGLLIEVKVQKNHRLFAARFVERLAQKEV